MTEQMIEVKTSELSGAALDWAVGIACGEDVRVGPGVKQLSVKCEIPGLLTCWSPSTNWSQGGPLIDKYQIDWWVCGLEDDGAEMIEAYTPINAGFGYSTSRLISACRAIVASKLGDTVSIPRELLP